MTPVETLTALAALSNRLSDPGKRISMGDHATLRRMDPLSPGRAALVVYGLLAELGVPLAPPEALPCWCVLTHALALARGAHDRAQSIGVALVAINFGEARVAQLLSADFALLSELTPRLARRLHAQQQRMDFAPLQRLLFAADRDSEATEKARLEIARSFIIATHSERESRKAP